MLSHLRVGGRTLLDGLIFIGLSLLCAVEGLRLYLAPRPDGPSQALAPGLYILILGGILFVTGVSHLLSRSASDDEEDAAAAPPPARLRVAAISALLAAYILFTDWLGYLAASLVFFVGTLWAFGVRDWRTNIVLSVVLTAACYLTFVHLLGVVFPRTGLFD